MILHVVSSALLVIGILKIRKVHIYIVYMQATGSSHGYDGTYNNPNLEDDDDDDHTWCGSDNNDDLECDGHFEESDDSLEGSGDEDDTCDSDEDNYSDHESSGPTSSREINVPTHGSGTRATN